MTALPSHNKFLVSAKAGEILILRMPAGRMTRPDALNLAAWLVAIADRGDEFAPLLETIKGSP